MLRSSSYLNRVDIGDGTSLLFNGLSLCMDLVPQSYADRLQHGDFSLLSINELEHLRERGHLTTLSRRREVDAFSRQARFILKRNSALAKRQELVVSFVLTYNCNLACRYCFQQAVSKKARAPLMSEEMVDEILTRHLHRLFPPAHRSNELALTIYGGEPFLPANRAAILRILRHAEQHRIEVSTTTNGIYLPRMIDLVGSEYGKIQMVQVTLDGHREFHDRQRVPPSGAATFDKIIAALRLLKGTSAQILLRVHTHPRQTQSTRDLVDYLENENITGDNVHLYFAPLNDFRERSNEEHREFRAVFDEVFRKSARLPYAGLSFLKDLMEMQDGKLLPRVGYCGAGSDTTRIVDPLGDIYDCYEDAGHRAFRIGSLAKHRLRFFRSKPSYAGRHILSVPECRRCALALYCGGGCPARARALTGSIFKPYCHQNKTAIADALRAYVIARKSGRKGEADETPIQGQAEGAQLGGQPEEIVEVHRCFRNAGGGRGDPDQSQARPQFQQVGQSHGEG